MDFLQYMAIIIIGCFGGGAFQMPNQMFTWLGIIEMMFLRCNWNMFFVWIDADASYVWYWSTSNGTKSSFPILYIQGWKNLYVERVDASKCLLDVHLIWFVLSVSIRCLKMIFRPLEYTHSWVCSCQLTGRKACVSNTLQFRDAPSSAVNGYMFYFSSMLSNFIHNKNL